MIKAFSQGGITVQGDLVMEKKVEYEVSNVETGGIGIQIVNGKDEQKPEEEQEASSKDEEKPHPRGPRKQYLFIEGDASWEEEGKLRSPSKENTVARRNERDRFKKYISNHKLGNRKLTCTNGDTINDIVACFLVVWQQRGYISVDFAGPSVWRFLHEECGFETTVSDKAYGKEIKEWVTKKRYKSETLREVRMYFP